MSSGDNRVVKFRKRRNINIGIIVFLIMFVYIAFNVYIYFTKEHITIYEVKKGTTAENNKFTGLILRDETIVNSDKAGYVSYLKKEGSRVSKNASIFSIDENNQIMDVITNGDTPITVSAKNDAELQYQIQNFKKTYSDDDFSSVYTFKESAQSTVLDILNTTMIEQGQKVEDETGLQYSYNIYQSQTSGIVSYYLDSFESVTPETVTPDMFKPDTYKRTSLRTNEAVKSNSPIYKMINSENWSIIVPLKPEQYEKLNGKEQIKFTILKDDFETSAKLALFKTGDNYYADISMTKLMSNYLDDRYLDLKLDFDSVDGLKIPVSAIIDKDFYVVPLDYFTKGANSDDDGLTVADYDKKTGEVSYNFVPTDIYYQDDTNAYVDATLFDAGTPIIKPNSSDEYKLTQIDQLTGVYNVNAGYAVFKRIETLFQDKEYCIIKDDTSNGLSVYDHIALDGKMVKDQKIIY